MYKFQIAILSFFLLYETAISQSIYSLQSFQHHSTEANGFVTLTDMFPFSQNADSFVIADKNLGDIEIKDDNVHELVEPYRSRFLKRKNIQETDSIFVYSLQLNKCYSFRVMDISLMAHLSPYGPDMPITTDQYMIGFEFGSDGLPYEELGYYYYNTIVAIEKSNPFNVGSIEEITWEKTENSNFPEFELSEIHRRWKTEWVENATRSDVFSFVSGYSVYYIQNMTRDGGMIGRHLAVVNSKNGKIVFSTFYFDSEGTYLLALNGVESMRMEGTSQWTGKLFADKPPIIFGFYGNSFGCPAINFVDQLLEPIYIQCDNRH